MPGTLGVAGALMICVSGTPAQGQTPAVAAELPEVRVVETTPLIGSPQDRYLLPLATQVLDADDIGRTGIPSLTDALLAAVPSAMVNDAEGNAFQPDILFRGFTASAVAGTPEGLAIYVNGARFNDAFGDTVNWDLIPPTAIAAVSLEAANPLFGLNALGGSLNVRLKDGFAFDASDAAAYGGSWGRGTATVESGGHRDGAAYYVTADRTHDDGFRQTGASDLLRFYGDLGWRDAATELHLGLTHANDSLGNPGAAPIQALAANLSSIFTAPNVVDNDYLGVNLRGNRRLGDDASLQGTAYFQRLGQVVPNGITVEVMPCGGAPGLLCNDDGSVVIGANGQQVPAFRGAGPYSGLSVQQLDSHAYGVTLQITLRSAWAAHENRFVAGAAFDGSDSVFAGEQQIGGFDPYTREFLGPGVVQDQESEGINPVRVLSVTHDDGLFVADRLALAPDLYLQLAARFNDAHIDLEDLLGGPVNGGHDYRRLDPGAGLTYRVTDALQIYGGYSEANRAPTPLELSCASPSTPCSLLNFFVGDPALKQVVARTFEGGLRGQWSGIAEMPGDWNVDAYRTRSSDDIIYESTLYNPNLAFYTNAGQILRQGLEAELRLRAAEWRVTAGYAFTDAQYRTPLVLNSPSNPAASAGGLEPVLPGDRLPGIARQRAHFSLDVWATPRWNLGAEMAVQGSAYRFGDEANLAQPIGGYAIVNLDTSLRWGDHLTLFAVIDNVLDRRYDTYGSFGPVADVPWPNIPGGVTDTRTASPGKPLSGYAGVRARF